MLSTVLGSELCPAVGVSHPPLSPALPKNVLADYHYGREEMLALFLKDHKWILPSPPGPRASRPPDLLDKEFLPILQEEPLLPLAPVPFTEEQRNFSMSINSAAVLQLTGRGGGGTTVGVPRGQSSSKGRGRGRGECGFYQGSFDEVGGNAQSWEEKCFDKPGQKDIYMCIYIYICKTFLLF
ncbi:hypothetical protein K5549_005658 [Capra hircus]|uniref:Uncharacterized protein n=1 Tax=Capra hircus TaxID=9925 RepID=A0A452F2F4_CAPHI|nr:hypothetical protein K5549_005658 [Capra hircus]